MLYQWLTGHPNANTIRHLTLSCFYTHPTKKRIPDYREICDGDVVNLDVTTYNAGGFHGDLNETYLVGKPDPDSERLVKTAFDCLSAALSLVKPGVLYRDLGTAIEKVAKANKCSVVRTYCGHGIGTLFHTVPNVPHYHKNKAKGELYFFYYYCMLCFDILETTYGSYSVAIKLPY